MTNVKKMTKRDYFNALLGIAEVKANDELVEITPKSIRMRKMDLSRTRFN